MEQQQAAQNILPADVYQHSNTYTWYYNGSVMRKEQTTLIKCIPHINDGGDHQRQDYCGHPVLQDYRFFPEIGQAQYTIKFQAQCNG